jgi:hypothetical protein
MPQDEWQRPWIHGDLILSVEMIAVKGVAVCPGEDGASGHEAPLFGNDEGSLGIIALPALLRRCTAPAEYNGRREGELAGSDDLAHNAS